MADSGSRSSMGIRTPDQRLRVFVSSTLEELDAERRAARAAIEQLRLAPVMFESGARPHPAQAVYRAYLEQSDVFVGIYWQRYGWVGPGMAVSGLEDEFRLSAGLPRLLYVKRPAPAMEPGLRRMLDRSGPRARWPTRRSPMPRTPTTHQARADCRGTGRSLPSLLGVPELSRRPVPRRCRTGYRPYGFLSWGAAHAGDGGPGRPPLIGAANR